MKRPRNHILETISDKRLRNIIPDEWVIRELSSDYGLDYMVEIFRNNQSTGNIFFIQLKSTDADVNPKGLTYQVKLKHLDYYGSIPNPVLFIIYSSKQDIFFGGWSNSLIGLLTSEQRKKQSLSLKFSHENNIDDYFFKSLLDSFSTGLPRKISISYSAKNKTEERYFYHLNNWLIKFFDKSITDKNLASFQILDLRFDEKSQHLIIKHFGKVTISSPLDFTENKELLLPVTNFKEVPQIFSETLITISLIFSRLEIKTSLNLIAICLVNYGRNDFALENVFSLMERADMEDRMDEFQNFIESAIVNKKPDIFQNAQLAILKYPDFKNRYQKNLIKAIEKFENDDIKGIFCYNLANSLNRWETHYESHLYYHKARKFRPLYTQMHYWWIEYANLLFLTEHYKIAEQFYRKAMTLINIEVIPFVNSYIADCLFFQKKFTDAQKLYKKQKETMEINELFQIKKQVCAFLIALSLDPKLFSVSKSLEKLDSGFKENQKDHFHEAIKYNPLNAAAWFNHALVLQSSGKFQEALDAFLVVIAIHDKDEEAWMNCFWLSYNLAKYELLTKILTICLDKFGDNFLNALSSSILNLEALPDDAKEMVIQAIKETADSIKSSTNS